MRVAIATTSSEKIAGVKNALCRFFGLEEQEIVVYSTATNSGVSDQPWGDETYEGAQNRVLSVSEKYPGMDFYVSCEAGIEKAFGQYFNVQVVCVLEAQTGMLYWGKSSGWAIPPKDIEIIRKGNLDKYLRGKGITCIEELLGPQNSRRSAVAQATELALASKKLN